MKTLSLTVIETKVMYLLENNRGRIVDIAALCGYAMERYDPESLRTHICRLRKKLGYDAIHTVQGKGYLLGDISICECCQGSGYVRQETPAHVTDDNVVDLWTCFLCHAINKSGHICKECRRPGRALDAHPVPLTEKQ